jgi:hypothetical protein
MRLLVTADIHYNHPTSRPVADELIDRMNRAGGDGILLVGDSATADGDALETCLSRFQLPDGAPRLFVAGNHELWTRGNDSHEIFTTALPDRVAALGWRWLETDPFVTRSFAVVGTIGWYDYSFAPANLGIPRRFYENKVSPGAAAHLPDYRHLLEVSDDIPPHARDVTARWNDGKFVTLHRPDEVFLDELLARLRSHLTKLASSLNPEPRTLNPILVATHHLPFRQLLPPLRIPQWDFAQAFLGSDKIGQLLLEFPQVTQCFCGHSHFPAEATIPRASGLPPLAAVNLGSGYRSKTFRAIDLPD